MKDKKTALVVSILAIVVIALIVFFAIRGIDSRSELVCFEDTCWDVEVVDTLETRTQGLMFRESLSENSGMWFVFPGNGTYPFWMKNTLISLDIIWVNENLEVVYIANAIPCEADPCPNYNPRVLAKFVLEINAGSAERAGLKVGDVLVFRD